MEGQPYRRRSSPPGAWQWLLWLMIFLLLFSFWSGYQAEDERAQLAYSEFKQALRDGRVEQLTFAGDAIRGEFRPPAQGDQPAALRDFHTVRPPLDDPELMELLARQDVTVRAETVEDPWWSQILWFLIPWLLLIGLLVWGMRRMQRNVMGGGGGSEGLFGFGKSRARRFREGATHVTFDEVAGLENAKLDLREIIGYLREPKRYRALGAKVPRGILLMGPPGTGKTLLAKAVAGEAGVPFYSISASEFIEMFVGVGAARVRDMFQSAKAEAPAIIFIDELDSVGRARGTGLGGGHDEREQTLNQILSEMDGFAPHEAVVVLAATNRPDVLDRALLRPGRFDRKVTLELPRKEARRRIFEVHTRQVPLASDVVLDLLSSRTVGFSGADIENLVNEAALLAARDHLTEVPMDYFARARDKIVLGAEREGALSDEEKQVVAYHESGHALLAHFLPEADPLDKVTIIPRGLALGATEQLPEEEKANVRRSYLLDRIAVMVGGRAAEEVVYGDVTSGSEMDLKQATQLVRRMVCQWGMSERIGPVTYSQGEEQVFLGRELAQPRDFSEATARLIDEEVKRIVETQYRRALDLLQEKRPQLDALAVRLCEQETLEAPEIHAIAQG